MTPIEGENFAGVKAAVKPLFEYCLIDIRLCYVIIVR